MDIKTRLTNYMATHIQPLRMTETFGPDHRDLFTLTERISEKTTSEGVGIVIHEIKIQFQKQMDVNDVVSQAKISGLIKELRSIISKESIPVGKKEADPIRQFHIGDEIIQTLIKGKLVSRRSVLFEIELHIKSLKKE